MKKMYAEIQLPIDINRAITITNRKRALRLWKPLGTDNGTTMDMIDFLNVLTGFQVPNDYIAILA